MRTIRYLLLLLLCGGLPRTVSYAGSPPDAGRTPAERHEKTVLNHPASEETKTAPKEEDFAGEEKLLHHKQIGVHTLPKIEKPNHAAAKPVMPKPAPVNITRPEQSTTVKSRPGNTLANSVAASTGPMTFPGKTVVQNKIEVDHRPPVHQGAVVMLGGPASQTARNRGAGPAALGGPATPSLKTTTTAISGTGYRGRAY
jgi:hypothetical protein